MSTDTPLLMYIQYTNIRTYEQIAVQVNITFAKLLRLQISNCASFA